MVIAYIIAVISFIVGVVFILGTVSINEKGDFETGDVLSVVAGLACIIFVTAFIVLGCLIFDFNKLHLNKMKLIITNVEELKDQNGEVHHIIWVDKHDNKFMYTKEEDDIKPREEDETDE